MMKLATACIVFSLIAPAFALAQETARERSFPAIESGKWNGARLGDGQPDIQGHWSNTIGNHSNFTDPQGRLQNEGGRQNRPQGPRDERAPSRVSDPADGQVPLQPWARTRQQEFQANLANPTRPEYVEPLARCFPGGVPKSFMWHGFENSSVSELRAVPVRFGHAPHSPR